MIFIRSLFISILTLMLVGNFAFPKPKVWKCKNCSILYEGIMPPKNYACPKHYGYHNWILAEFS